MADEPNLPILQKSHGPGIVVLAAGFALLVLGLGVFSLVRAVTIDHTTRTAQSDAYCRDTASSGDGARSTFCTVFVTSTDQEAEVEVDEDTRAGDEVRVELESDGTVSTAQSRVGLVVVALMCLGIGGGAAYFALLVSGGAMTDDPLRAARDLRYRLRPR